MQLLSKFIAVNLGFLSVSRAPAWGWLFSPLGLRGALRLLGGSLPWGPFCAFTLLLENIMLFLFFTSGDTLLLKRMQEFLEKE